MANSMVVHLVAGIRTFKLLVSPEALAEAWANRDYSKIQTLVPWEKLPQHVEPAMKEIGKAAVFSAKNEVAKLPPNINTRLRFDLTNPDIAHYVRNRTGKLITTLESGIQQAVQDAVASHFTNSLTPRQVAAQIKGSIGLLPAHEIAVVSYRRGLTASGMLPKRIDALVGRYEDRLLDYRARMIARTETRRAFQEGQIAVWHEGKRQGLMKSGSKVWDVDGDPCEICEPMDGVSVGLEDSFEVSYPDGSVANIMYPAESHPSCECGMNLSFETAEDE